MPQGLQVWDASGALIVDTSTLTYKESTAVSDNTDGVINVPAEIVGQNFSATVSVDPGVAGVDVIADPSAGQLAYKFSGGGGNNVRIRLAAF